METENWICANALLLVRNVTIDGGGGVGVLDTKRPDWLED